MAEHILGPDNEPDFELQEVLNIKGPFWAQSSWRINLSNLDELLVDIVSDDLLNSCLVGRRCPGASKEYWNGGRRSNWIPTEARRLETPVSQHLFMPRWGALAIV